MKTSFVTCSMCGHTFDAAQHAACTACPLHQGCAMICCPACGYSTIDPNRSQLARWVSVMFKKDLLRDQQTDS